MVLDRRARDQVKAESERFERPCAGAHLLFSRQRQYRILSRLRSLGFERVKPFEAEGEGLEPPCADLQRTSRFRNEGNTILPAFLGCREGQSPSKAESRGIEPLHPFQDGNRLPSGRFTDSANSPF